MLEIKKDEYCAVISVLAMVDSKRYNVFFYENGKIEIYTETTPGNFCVEDIFLDFQLFEQESQKKTIANSCLNLIKLAESAIESYIEKSNN